MKNKQSDLHINIIKALRNGTVPNQGTNELAVGIENELNEAFEQMNEIKNKKTAFKFIIGGYGSGKTFLSTAIKEMAYNDNFVVSSLTISKDTPLHKFDELYKKIMENLRTKSENNTPALSSILEEWLLKLEDKILSLTDIDIDEDFEQFKIEMSKKIKEELSTVDEISGSYSNAIYSFYEARYKGDSTVSEACINWLKGEKINSELRNKIKISGNLNKENSLSFLKSFLYIIKTVGYEGLVISFDELEIIQRISRSDIRKTAYENLRLFIDESDKNALPYCYLLYTGTNELMESENGFKSLQPLYQRVTVKKDDRYKNLRQPIIYIDGFNEMKLIDVAKKVVTIHEKAYQWDSTNKITDKFLNKLIEETILGLQKSQKEVAPRGFIRILVDILDKSEIHPAYNPLRDFCFTEDVEDMFTATESNSLSNDKPQEKRKNITRSNTVKAKENKSIENKKQTQYDQNKENNYEDKTAYNDDAPILQSDKSTVTQEDKIENSKEEKEEVKKDSPIEVTDDKELEDILGEGLIEDDSSEDDIDTIKKDEINIKENSALDNEKEEEFNVSEVKEKAKDNEPKEVLEENETIDNVTEKKDEDDGDDFLNEILCEDTTDEPLDIEEKDKKKNQSHQVKKDKSNLNSKKKEEKKSPSEGEIKKINNDAIAQKEEPQQNKEDVLVIDDTAEKNNELKEDKKNTSPEPKDNIIEFEDDLDDYLSGYLDEEPKGVQQEKSEEQIIHNNNQDIENAPQKKEDKIDKKNEKQDEVNEEKFVSKTKTQPKKIDTNQEQVDDEEEISLKPKEKKSKPTKKQGMFGFFKNLISSDDDEKDDEKDEEKDDEKEAQDEPSNDIATQKLKKWKQAMSLQDESEDDEIDQDDLNEDNDSSEDDNTPMFFGGEYKVLQNVYIETEDGDREKFDQLIIGPNGVFFTRNVEDSGTLTLKDNTFYNRGKISHRLGNVMEVSKKILKEVLKENEIESEVVGIINLMGCESEESTCKEFRIMNEEKVVGFVYNFKSEKRLNVNQVGKIYKEVMSFNDI